MTEDRQDERLFRLRVEGESLGSLLNREEAEAWRAWTLRQFGYEPDEVVIEPVEEQL